VLPRDARKAALDVMKVLDFTLPLELEASEPPEARGLARDQVRLMVSTRSDNQVYHTRFRQIGDFLQPGDVVVINTSGTLNAALNTTRASDQQQFELHLSTRLPADLWAVEVREPCGDADHRTTKPYYTAQAGEVYELPGGARATLLTPYNATQREPGSKVRLWLATISFPMPPQRYLTYLEEYGFPIRYSYVREGWDSRYYQTVYANEMGSAEMPSAGRAFTPELITKLIAQGVQIVPLILHTGVASLEDHEPPYEEYYRVPAATAQTINTAKARKRRVIAVGTTVIRALETVTDAAGVTHPGEGWTNVIITPQRGIKAVNGLLTGLHEPKATHLAMLEALANREHLGIAYQEALTEGYLWHEFGDLHLILP
jgi:S-adenosylmethionine:tRNA ribosyltransferase-isomerase